MAEYHFGFPIHINETWVWENYLYFPPLYQVRYTILSPKGEDKQLGWCVYGTWQNINNLAKRQPSLTFFPSSFPFLPPNKGLNFSYFLTLRTSFQWSHLWNHLFPNFSGVCTSPPALPRSFPLPSNIPVSGCLLIPASHPAARRDQLWQMDNHKHCSLSCPR